MLGRLGSARGGLGTSIALAGLSELTPDALPNLVGWGEGSDLGDDGTSIASWLNKTGSGLDPAQATAGNKPTVKANIINGQKAVEFTAASSQFLAFPAGALGWFQNVAGATLAVVYQAKTLTAVQRPLYVQTGGTAGRIQMSTTTTPQLVASGRSTDAGFTASAIGATPVVGTPVIVCGIVSYSGGIVTLLVNGVTAAINSALAPAQNTDNTASAGIGIGAVATTAGSPTDGYVAAYAMWNVAYSRAQLDGVLRRWAHLYGIPLTG